MERIARASLRNRSFVALVCVVAAILGGISIASMRQELIPQVELPAVSIIAVSPGATAEQMNERVAVPVERQMATLPDVKETTANSSSSYSMITVELDYGTEISRATSKIEQAISRVEDSFPEGTTTQVASGGTSDIPLAMIGATSSGDPLQMAENVRSAVLPQLEKIEGVASAQLIGAPEQQVSISLDMEKAAAAGVTPTALQDALDANGLAIPVGTVAGDGHTLDVTVGQKIDSLDALREIPVLTEDPIVQDPLAEDPFAEEPFAGDPLAEDPFGDDSVAGVQDSVPLGQVATVELVGKEAALTARINGEAAVAIIIFPTANANIVDTSRAVNETLDELSAMVGGDSDFTMIFDQAPFITTSISALAEEGGMGLVMAVVVILLFLVSLRSTLVTAISIPLSLLLAFIGMFAAGYSLNMLTLSALTITIGRVVDDSIVVIENIKRHLEYGEPKRRAILTAVGEVASAITASTIVTCLVFVPIGMVSGMVGELFKPFAFTVVLAMAASLLVALTIVPVLAYWFLRPSKAARSVEESVRAVHTVDDVLSERPAREAIARARALIEQQREAAEAKEDRSWLRRAYRPALRGSQKHPVITLVAAVAILAASGALYPMLKVNLLGDTGQNMVQLSQEAPAGTDMPGLVERAAVAEEALMGVAGVETVATTIGGAGMGQSASSISYVVTTAEGADQEALGKKLEEVLAEKSSGDRVALADMTAMASSTMDINIVANTEETLQQANAVLLEALQGVEGSKEVTSNLVAEQPSVKVTVNRAAAATLGLSENDVVGLISSQLVTPSIGQITLNNIDTDIYIALADPVTSLADLQNMQILGMPISQLATVEEVDVVPSVVTINGQKTATISVVPENSDELGAVKDAVARVVDNTELPEGAITTQAGAAAQIDDVFGQLGLALAGAILLIYVVLVWIFKSLSQPLVLLVSIPFAAIGAFLALFLTGTPLGISALVGLLMLTGVVVTNAIVLIDLINQYRRNGMDMDEAIDMGSQRRLRPIVMTAVATIAALIPMALGITGHAGFISQPLAVTVIGGLLSSTALTLILLPVLYRLTQKRSVRAAEGEDWDEAIHAIIAGEQEAPVDADVAAGGTEESAARAPSSVAGGADRPVRGRGRAQRSASRRSRFFGRRR